MFFGDSILRRAIDIFEYGARQTLLRHLPEVFDAVGTEIVSCHEALQILLRRCASQSARPHATATVCRRYLAAVTTISTSVVGLPSSTATHARVGGFFGSIQASHAWF